MFGSKTSSSRLGPARLESHSNVHAGDALIPNPPEPMRAPYKAPHSYQPLGRLRIISAAAPAPAPSRCSCCLLLPTTWQRAGAGTTRRVCVTWPRAKERGDMGVSGGVSGGGGGGVIAPCHPPSFPKLGIYYGYILTENTNCTLRQRGAREGTQSNTIASCGNDTPQKFRIPTHETLPCVFERHPNPNQGASEHHTRSLRHADIDLYRSRRLVGTPGDTPGCSTCKIQGVNRSRAC